MAKDFSQLNSLLLGKCPFTLGGVLLEKLQLCLLLSMEQEVWQRVPSKMDLSISHTACNSSLTHIVDIEICNEDADMKDTISVEEN